jgi:hypothetical protein
MNSRMKRKLKGLGLLIMAAPLLLFFQNCSKGISTISNNLKLSSESGNGTGYDGKPGKFFNFVPNFNCAGQDSFAASLTRTSIGFEYIKNSTVACGLETRNLVEADLDFSPYHRTLAGYENKIFEYSENDFTRIPDRLVEAWCFDIEGQKKIEIVQQYNNADQTSTGHVYYSLPSGLKEIVPFSTIRL